MCVCSGVCVRLCVCAVCNVCVRGLLQTGSFVQEYLSKKDVTAYRSVLIERTALVSNQNNYSGRHIYQYREQRRL